MLTPGVNVQELYLKAYDSFLLDEKKKSDYARLEASYAEGRSMLRQAANFHKKVGEARFPSIADAHERIKAAGIRKKWHAEQLLIGFGTDVTYARAIADSWAELQESQHGFKSINTTKQGTSFEQQKAATAEAATEPTKKEDDSDDDEPETITSMGKYMSSSIYMTDVDPQLRSAFVSFEAYKSFMQYPDDPESPEEEVNPQSTSPPPPSLPESAPPPSTPATQKKVSFGPVTSFDGDGQTSPEQYDLAYALQASLDLYQRNRNSVQLSEAAAAAIRRQTQAMAKNRPYRGRRRY
jgi:hypothetical protein